MSDDIYGDYWRLRETLHFVVGMLEHEVDMHDTPAQIVVRRAKQALKETDLAYIKPAEEKMDMTDAEVDALITSDQGDSYYVTLPDGSSTPIGFTAESWSEPSERREAARHILEAAK